ncbi:phage terminase small subunit P27 family [Nocardioides aquiterrae]|uniref:Phage terminase small subunit P27 family n=1 Tax=Nocardioides aquiterrae TaxID=203799 RepID=A0ABN1UKF1_9ACTN
MSRPGRKPKPTLQVVREGNPGHRPVRDGVTLPPTALKEPDWPEWFAGDDDETTYARDTAAELWRRTAPTLSRSMGLVNEQGEVLTDYCVTWARIVQGERSLTRDGVLVESGRADRGRVKNPWTTVLNQYRSHMRSLAGELGLTPSAASRLVRPPVDGGEDDPFD